MKVGQTATYPDTMQFFLGNHVTDGDPTSGQ